MRLRRMPETFQSTPSVWRETVLQVVGQSTGHHFNPLPPYGGRHQSAQYHLHYKLFQSTPSVWRETSRRRTFPDSQQRISIHSLRMEGDFVLFEVHHITCYFNPLPPYGGRRLIRYPFSRIHAFQSTPSVWRETRTQRQRHGERGISIHSLRMEGDIFRNKNRTRTAYFNPLPPYGGRQHYAALVLVSADISIHSLRMEGDRASRTLMGISQYFNSLPPYGGRRVAQ